ncbi:MAG: HDOD domain-containing protein [Desulfarculus sp.]|nr:HDOD domain-containing protein [Desulfarculus sp.]
MDQRGQEILARALARDQLPSLSAIALRLVQMASDEEVSAPELARIITQDPGLAARLLRMANSPAFRRGSQEITSLDRAVVLLGLREVRIMALSISLRDTLPTKGKGLDYRIFWRASLYRALLSRAIANRLALPQPEEAFVAGLLLETGLPILLRVLKPEELDGFPGLGASLRAQMVWERQRLGLDHRQVGAEVMRRWGLPQTLVACQGVLQESSRDQAPLLKEVTDFARQAAEAFLLPEKLLTDVHQIAWRYFGLDDDTVNLLLTEALLAAGEAAAALEVDLDPEADLLAVVEKANQTLAGLTSRLDEELHNYLPPASGSAPARAASGEGDQLRRAQDEAVAHTLDAVAHEIRNPLMSVGGFARRLAAQAAAGDKVQRYAQAILAEAARLDQALDQINRMLSPYQPRPRKLDLAQLLARMAEPGQGLLVNLPEGPLLIWADPQGLEAALGHLLAYARHLLVDRDATPCLRLSLTADPQGVRLICQGKGAPPANQADAMARRAFGPELALAQARRIAAAHGGEVELGPDPQGEGFILTLRLPNGAAQAA